MVELALYLKQQRHAPAPGAGLHPDADVDGGDDVLPGIDPLTMEPVYTATGLREKRLQKALLLYWDPRAVAARARGAARRRGARDLIGHGAHCLVPP